MTGRPARRSRTERDHTMLAAAERRAPVRARTSNGRPVTGTLTFWPLDNHHRNGARARIRTITAGAYISVDPATVELLAGLTTVDPNPDLL